MNCKECGQILPEPKKYRIFGEFSGVDLANYAKKIGIFDKGDVDINTVDEGLQYLRSQGFEISEVKDELSTSDAK